MREFVEKCPNCGSDGMHCICSWDEIAEAYERNGERALAIVARKIAQGKRIGIEP